MSYHDSGDYTRLAIEEERCTTGGWATDNITVVAEVHDALNLPLDITPYHAVLALRATYPPAWWQSFVGEILAIPPEF